MSLEADKKTQHARLADQAMSSGEHQKAAFNLAKAAEYGLKLAERCDGKVRRKYLREAHELIDLAEGLKAKAKQAHPSNGAVKPIPTSDASEAKNSEPPWMLTEKPSIRLADVAGMDSVKAKLQDMIIAPLAHADQARAFGIRPGGGILLYGPPGTGKTTLGKAVAGELNADFFYATGAEIRSKWHGESEQKLRKLIGAARARPVSVLFLDDVDGLLPRRGGNSVVDNRIVVQFLNEIGGFTDSANVLLLLGATNNPWDIDEAVFRTGRFDEKIYVGLPDRAAREFMVHKELGPAPLDPACSEAQLADVMNGYTGSDVVGIVASAKRIAFRRTIQGGSNVITLEDVRAAMATIPASVTSQHLREYEKFAQARFRS